MNILTLLLLGCLLQDTVVLENGDTLTGEVVTAEKGKLVFNSALAGEVKIDMAKVKSITTKKPITMILKDGEVIRGVVVETKEGKLSVDLGQEDNGTVDWSRVVEINPPEKVKYSGFLALGGTSSSGNTDRVAFNLSAEARRISEDDRFLLRLLWNYAEEDDIRTVRDIFGSIKYDYLFSERFYGWLRAELLADEFKDLDLRVIAGGGIGYTLIQEKDVELEVELGVTYVSENREVGMDEDHVAAKVALALSFTISETIKFADKADYNPSLEENEYTARNEATITNALGGGWSLKFSNILEYDSDPTIGFERLDVRWVLALQYKF